MSDEAPRTPTTFDGPDAELAAAVSGDDEAPYDLDGLAAEVGTTRALLEAVERAGLLVAPDVAADGTPRYADADADAVRAGLTLLDAGLPLGELLDLARRTDTAIRAIADHAVEAFVRFVRDPVRGSAASESEAAERLVTAYERMLPATEVLVAHHLRRRLVAGGLERVIGGDGPAAGDDDPAEPGQRR